MSSSIRVLFVVLFGWSDRAIEEAPCSDPCAWDAEVPTFVGSIGFIHGTGFYLYQDEC